MSTEKHHMILITNYSIPNKDLAESELRNL